MGSMMRWREGAGSLAASYFATASNGRGSSVNSRFPSVYAAHPIWYLELISRCYILQIRIILFSVMWNFHWWIWLIFIDFDTNWLERYFPLDRYKICDFQQIESKVRNFFRKNLSIVQVYITKHYNINYYFIKFTFFILYSVYNL